MVYSPAVAAINPKLGSHGPALREWKSFRADKPLASDRLSRLEPGNPGSKSPTIITTAEADIIPNAERIITPGHPTCFIMTDEFFHPIGDKNYTVDDAPEEEWYGHDDAFGEEPAPADAVAGPLTGANDTAALPITTIPAPTFGVAPRPSVTAAPMDVTPASGTAAPAMPSETAKAALSAEVRAAVISQILSCAGVANASSGDLTQMREALISQLTNAGNQQEALGGPSS
ncbi:hypothetical protein BWQ96_09262 [Gracilariopsis chorda]|uniref:Uncharacterized protein n=1 Tax=Gracilariopsis chorda TaxID=448386 RepID=A0A2V3IG49_9FLOR|nr:hypothetical protein BWQ96_09262 [Gracilariopsis chorda]|eukprot:PXF41022.1 hypothetical protein BWQ96_09262 [Gracilariopsis chorda]